MFLWVYKIILLITFNVNLVRDVSTGVDKCNCNSFIVIVAAFPWHCLPPASPDNPTKPGAEEPPPVKSFSSKKSIKFSSLMYVMLAVHKFILPITGKP